ncbi:NERD domain-containing protein [Nocardia sp. Marseille-Q1738]
MLVINERTTAPRSEQRVLDWMRSWTGQYVIVGVAISGCYLPVRDRTDEAQEADLVVITPRAAIVIEVKDTAPEAMTGVLSVQANGRWRLSGFEGDPIHVRDNESSPFDGVTNNVFNLKELVREHHPEVSIDGLIVVVPPRESTVTLNIESRRKGCGVVLGNTPVELRAWFHRTASRKLIWTAERVHALLGDLNLADQVSIEDLVADGFPLERTPRGESGPVVLEGAAPVEGLPSADNSDAVGVPTDVEVPSSNSTLEQPDVVPTAIDGTPSVEDSDAGGVATDVNAPSSNSTFDQPDVVPIAPELNVSGSIQPPDSDDLENGAAVASDRPIPPLTAPHMRTRSDASEPVASGATVDPSLEGRQPAHSSPSIADRQSFADRQPLDFVDEPGDDAAEPISRPHHLDGLPAARFAQTQRVEPDPRAPMAFASGPVAPEPPQSDATSDFAAQSEPPLSSPFTDRWSSWIESDAQPVRPRPTPSALPNPPQWWSDEETEARPPRRPTAPRLLERRPRIADLRQTITVPPRTRTHTTGQPRPIGHRPQQIAAVALIAVVIGTIWVLAAACSTPQGDAVRQTPLPPSTTETPARFDLLPLCLPLRSDC